MLTLDVGSSSARTLLFGFDGRQIENFGSQVPYRAHTTPDGGWEIDPAELTAIAARALGDICEQMRAKGVKPVAVAVDTFWHSIVGVDADGNPTTPLLHPFDTRSADAAKRLAQRVDNRAQHNRTGCVIHPSYPPAKLLWLSETQPEAFQRTKHWMSAGEFLFLKFFGKAAASTSMVSATGLWDQNANDYDAEMLAALPVSRAQFAAVEDLDQPANGAAQWPELQGIPWFPALGDGACDNVGSGCTTRDRFALMVGTSGAMRAVVEADRIEIPDGLFCYRVDREEIRARRRAFQWRRSIRLDEADPRACPTATTIIETPACRTCRPPQHGLTILPLFAGERSTGWRADARAAIIGLGANTSPIEILQAALESVALRFRNVYEIMQSSLGAPREIVASGAALLHSPVWTQMMADTLVASDHPSASSPKRLRAAPLCSRSNDWARSPTSERRRRELWRDDSANQENGALYRADSDAPTAALRKLFEENQ